jgi:hypothetical protein
MNAVAHNFQIDLSPDELGEDAAGLAVHEVAVLLAVIPVMIVGVVAASVLQVVYDALILLWAMFGLPLIRAMRASARIAATGVEKVGVWVSSARPQSGGPGKHEVALTFDELALIYKSLEATKTLGALPPQDELLDDTIRLVDLALTGFGR